MSANDVNAVKPVALLARPGEAHERLRAALIDAGAMIVLDQDPLLTTRESLIRSAPSAVVMMLEPAVEDCLEELEMAFQAIGTAVIYEEADVVARRAGWESQRWGRHLIAKLYGHNDVLPPGSEKDGAFQLEPGKPVTPQELAAGAQWEPHLHEALERAEDLPEDSLKPFNPDTDVFGGSRWSTEAEDAEAEADVEPEAGAEESSPFAIVLENLAEEEIEEEETPQLPDDEPLAEPDPVVQQESSPSQQPARLEPKFENFGFSMEMMLPSDSSPPPETEAETETDFSPESFVFPESAPPRAASVPPPLGPVPEPVPEYVPEPIPERPPSLSLVDIEPTIDPRERVAGAILVMAGIGGPDAVRRLLSELPPDFPRPVLVQLRLDGGRYDNLVKQMSRVSGLPVTLADVGERLRRANTYVLPENVGVHFENGTAHFVEAVIGDDVIAALPPAESGVLMLSGSDPMRVEMALALSARGGYLAGQAVDGCYDPVAVNLLAADGIELGTPAQLATELMRRWIE